MNTRVLSDSIKDYYRLLMASKSEKSDKQKNRYDIVLIYTDEQEAELLSVISTRTPEEAGLGVFAN